MPIEPNDVMKDLEDMGKVFDEIPDPDGNLNDELGTDAPSTDDVSTEAPSTDEPSTDAPGTDSPETDAPTTEAPEEDPRDEELRKLKAEMEELKASKNKPSTNAPSTNVPTTDAPLAEQDFLSDEDITDVLSDKNEFNKLLNKVYKKAFADAKQEMQKADETIVREMPSIVKNNLALMTELENQKNKFYEDNKDLVPFKKVVGLVFEEKFSESPDKSYEEILPEVATEVRKRLDLHKKANRKSDDETPPPPPRKSKKGKRSQPKPSASSMESELSAMDEALGL